MNFDIFWQILKRSSFPFAMTISKHSPAIPTIANIIIVVGEKIFARLSFISGCCSMKSPNTLACVTNATIVSIATRIRSRSLSLTTVPSTFEKSCFS